jgi:hypothetical protein
MLIHHKYPQTSSPLHLDHHWQIVAPHGPHSAQSPHTHVSVRARLGGSMRRPCFPPATVQMGACTLESCVSCYAARQTYIAKTHVTISWLLVLLRKLRGWVTAHQRVVSCLRLARIVYIHRIWPYIWLFPCQKYRVYAPYIYGSGQP